MLIGITICFAPVGLVIYASSVATRHECVLHEGFANPCVIDGVDHGQTLYAMGVSGWFMLITLPVAAVLFLLLVCLIMVDLVRRARRRRTN